MRITTAGMRRWIRWPRLPSTSWRRGWRNWSSSPWNWRKVGKKKNLNRLGGAVISVTPMRQNHPLRKSLFLWWKAFLLVSRLFCSFLSFFYRQFTDKAWKRAVCLDFPVCWRFLLFLCCWDISHVANQNCQAPKIDRIPPAACCYVIPAVCE